MSKGRSACWNYRVVQKPGEGFFICEVYYRQDRETVFHFSQNPVLPFGTSVDALRDDYSMMLQALGLPVLQYEDLLKACGRLKVAQ